MKNRASYLMAVMSLLLLFNGCGSDSTTNNLQKSILSEDNFISMAKYYFTKESKNLLKDKSKDSRDNEFRSYPGATKSDIEIKNSLKITAVTPFNKYIESMTIKSNNRTLVIRVKNRKYVDISLYEGETLLENHSEPLSKFKNLEIDGMGEEI